MQQFERYNLLHMVTNMQQKRRRVIQWTAGLGAAMIQIGIDSFAAAISDPATGLTLSPVERMQHRR
jgi:hypothetical protein